MAAAGTVELSELEPLATIQIPGNPSAPTRHRWRMVGVLDASGNRVRLPTWKAGNKVMTTRRAVSQFIAALSADAGGDLSGDTPVDNGRAAGKALEALGC